jgi:uncharacterized protein DUF6600/FecR-like protein
MLRRLVFVSSAAVLALTARVPAALAQEPEPAAAPPAHVAFVEGTVTLERDGRPEASVLNMPLLSGDRVRTTDGRVEIAFADGNTLQVDNQTTVDFESDELMRLIDGRVRVTIGGPARQVAYRIDAPVGSVRIAQPGVYRVSILRGEAEPKLELAVLRGAAEIFTDQGTTDVRAGERAYASAGLAPSYAYAYNSAQWDAFDRWAEARRDVRLGVSAQYLPQSMQTYDTTFDQYGDWRYAEPYGNVWYPRVAVGWRPYYYGRWTTLPVYGWTWIGADPFAWPTHHYGRWGFSSGLWFWIPGTRWGSAWVSWAYAPGYVSWCPLGFDDRPIFGLNVGYFGGRYSPWRAWTVVPSPFFHRGFVPRHAVFVDGWRNRPAFVQRQGPAVQSVAVTRAAPIRWAGTPAGSHGIAVPRSGSTYFSNGAHSASPDGPRFPAPARAPRDLRTAPATELRGNRGAVRDPGAAASPNPIRGQRAPGVARPERTPAGGSTAPRAPAGQVIERSHAPAGTTSPPVNSARSRSTGSAQRRSLEPSQSRAVAPAPRREYAPRYDVPSVIYGRTAPGAAPRAEAPPSYNRPTQTAVPRYEASPAYGRSPERVAPRYEPSPSFGRAPDMGVRPGPMAFPPQRGPMVVPAPPAREMPPGGMPGGRSMAVPRSGGSPPPAASQSAPASRPAAARGGGHRGR